MQPSQGVKRTADQSFENPDTEEPKNKKPRTIQRIPSCHTSEELFNKPPSIEQMLLEFSLHQNTLLNNQQLIIQQQSEFNSRLNEIQNSISQITSRTFHPLPFKPHNEEIIVDERVKNLFQDLQFSPRDTKLITNHAHLEHKILNEFFRIDRQVQRELKKNENFYYKQMKFAKNVKLDENPGFCIGTQSIKPNNEDKFCHFGLEFVTSIGKKTASCFAIFDGHGGDDASIFCQNNIEPALNKCLSELCKDGHDYEIANAMRLAFVLLDASFRELKLRRPGTTAILVVIIEHHLFIANCGDCRAILIPENPLECKQLSYDFKASDVYAKKSLANRGGFVSSLDLVERAQGFLAVTRAIGDETLRDQYGHKPTTPLPNVTMIDLKQIADRKRMHLLFCSDGLTDVFSTNFLSNVIGQLRNKVIKNTENKVPLATMVSVLIAEARKNEAKDDITLGLIDLNGFCD